MLAVSLGVADRLFGVDAVPFAGSSHRTLQHLPRRSPPVRLQTTSTSREGSRGAERSWGASYLPNPPDLLKLALLLLPPALVRWPGHGWHVAFVIAFPAYLSLLRAWPGPAWLGGTPWALEATDTVRAKDETASLPRSPLGPAAAGRGYRGYVTCAAVVGVLLPGAIFACSAAKMAIALMRGSLHAPCFSAAGALGIAHTFLLMAQILTEDYHRKRSFPLILRILVPICYNALRLPLLWSWVVAALSEGSSSWLLIVAALGNFLVWYFNLLFFLLPVALRAYAKAYFHAVETPESRSKSS